ncbi:DinB family protein [Streptomyces sp. NPDC000594]|uniref:DinB family protein n=1 Tax=Streptomyces sp. NPDC000594 TaxID=3154261 RepID=UPI0033267400
MPPLRGGDERVLLSTWLDFQRETLALKCAGLGEEELRRASVEPSIMSLLGLVQHMEAVERNWFQQVVAGRDAPWQDAEGNGFMVPEERTAGEVVASWREELERSREVFVAAGALDRECALVEQRMIEALGDTHVTLRWIIVHLIGEYARHNGHADLLRERADGATGF